AAEKLGAAGLAADSLNFVAVAPRALVMLPLENPALNREGCAGTGFAVLCKLAPAGLPPSLTGEVGGGAPASVGMKPLMNAIAWTPKLTIRMTKFAPNELAQLTALKNSNVPLQPSPVAVYRKKVDQKNIQSMLLP